MNAMKLPKTGSRGEYKKVSAEDKAKVADYASKNSVSAAIRHFKHTGSFEDLKESTVRDTILNDGYSKSVVHVPFLSFTLQTFSNCR